MHAARAQPGEMPLANQQPGRRGLLLLRERTSQRIALLPGARAHCISVGRSAAQQRGCVSIPPQPRRRETRCSRGFINHFVRGNDNVCGIARPSAFALEIDDQFEFHGRAHAAQDREPSQVCRLGGTSPCRSFPARGGLSCGCPSTRRCRSSQRSSPRGPVRAPLRRSRRSSGCLPVLPRGVGCERVAAPAGAGGGRRCHPYRQLNCQGASQILTHWGKGGCALNSLCGASISSQLRQCSSCQFTSALSKFLHAKGVGRP